MLRYLSDEWLAAADELVQAHAGLRDATADRSLVLGQTVTGAGASGEDVTYRIVLGDGATDAGGATNRIDVGDGPCDVHLTTDVTTAVAVATATRSAQTAFLEGRIRVGGDVPTLIAHQDLLAELDDVLAPLRANTTFPG